MEQLVFISWLIVLCVLTTAQEVRLRNHRVRQPNRIDNSIIDEAGSSKNGPPILLNLIVVPVIHDGNNVEERQPLLKQPRPRPIQMDHGLYPKSRVNMIPRDRYPNRLTEWDYDYSGERDNRGPAQGLLPTVCTSSDHIYDSVLGKCIPLNTESTTRHNRRGG